MRSDTTGDRLQRFFVAFALSVFICVVRVVSGILWGQIRGVGLTSWIYLIAVAFALGHAMFSVWEMQRVQSNRPLQFTARGKQRRLIQAAWLVATYLALMAWPSGSSPPASITSLLVVVIVFGLPIAVAESPLSSKRVLRLVDYYPRVLTTLVLGAMVVATTSFLWQVRPSIGGVDFFFYIRVSREMVEDWGSVPPSCYGYFPGVYAFWRNAIRLIGDSIDGLQWCYLAVLIVNAVLVIAIVARTCRSYAAAIYAAIWYVVLCSRWQGFVGGTEPIATVFFLLGLLIWSGHPLRGKSGFISAVAMGMGLGLTVFSKQNAGLLSLGALSLLVNYLFLRDSRRHSFQYMVLLPVVAIITLVVAVLMEGKGLEPFRIGLLLVEDYHTYGSWISNLNVLAKRDETALYVGVLIVLVWLGLLIGSRRWQLGWRLVGQPWFELVGFCTIAGLATLIQFQRRPYAHYAILTVPAMVIAGVLMWVHIVPWIIRHAASRRMVWFAFSILAMFPLIDFDGNHESLQVWQLRNHRWQTIWHNHSLIAKDLRRLREQVPPGKTMLIVPSRTNSPRYILHGRATKINSFTFDNPRVDEIPWSQYDLVLIIDSKFVSHIDNEFWPDEKRREVIQMMNKFEFERVEVELEAMSLFRKNSK